MGLILISLAPVAGYAAEGTVKTVEKAPPQEVGASLAKLLQPQAIQVTEGGKTVYEFWFRNHLPLKSRPESAVKGLDALDPTTFMGIAVVGQGQRDYKDNEIAPGTYTVRFSLQPQDGDHLGTAEFLFFAVLIPAKSDTELDSIKTYKTMVKASAKASPAGHPLVLSLRPPAAEPGKAPAIVTPAGEHRAIRLTLPAKVTGADEGTNISLDVVYHGRYEG